MVERRHERRAGAARADVSLARGHGAVVAHHGADAVIASAAPTGDLLHWHAAWQCEQCASSARTYCGRPSQRRGAFRCTGGLAAALWLPGWVMAGSSLLVVLNALRASPIGGGPGQD